MKTFEDLFLHFLQDMYFAEQSILKILPEMVEAAQNRKLKKSLSDHIEETKEQIKRIERAFDEMGKPVEAVTCEAILGLLQETEDVLKEVGSPGPIMDAGLMACAQSIEHYEIARFRTLTSWATSQGMNKVAPHLLKALNVERAKNASLNELALSEVFEEAMQA